jgi:hypothetical protein
MAKDECMRDFQMQVDYVKQNAKALREEYGEKYIAVMGQSVIDSDTIKFRLSQRVHRTPRKQFVLINTIDCIAEMQGGIC